MAVSERIGSLSVAEEEEGSLAQYLNEISREAPLSSIKEIELAQRIRGGDRNALDQLTRANLRFVVRVAKQYQNQGLSLGDLINEGNLGLIKAIKRFDETKGYRFISYAVWWIRQSILQALAEQSRIVRLPLSRISILSKICRTSSGLEQTFGRLPSLSEIAQELDLEDYDVVQTMTMSGRHLSLDAPFGDENGRLLDTLEDRIHPPPDELIIQQAMRTDIRRALATLSHREAEILRLYFGIDEERAWTLEEIGERLGLTRERVRQIKEKAIQRLRRIPQGRILRTYLG
jgi:RNA polymerase primary sigma factor